MVSLEAIKASETVAQQGKALAQDPIYHPDWSIRHDDTCSNPIKACDIRRGCVTPRDFSEFSLTPSNDLKGLIFELVSQVSLVNQFFIPLLALLCSIIFGYISYK